MLLKTIEAALSDNYMIHYTYAHNVACFNEPPSDTEILCTGRRIAAGMIMYEYDRSSGRTNCWAEDLSRMNKARRQRSLGNLRLGDHSISAIEEKYHKVFLPPTTNTLAKVMVNISSSIDSISPFERAGSQSSSDLYGCD